MSFVFINLAVIAALVAVDQALKLWAVSVLAPVGSMPFIPHVMDLRFVLNEGAAFSMLSGKQTLLIVVTGVALLAVTYWVFFRCRGREHRWERISMLLILSGGLGNLIDRVANGCVVDYLNFLFMEFPVFNFADICVCVGVGLYILCIFLEEAKSQKENG